MKRRKSERYGRSPAIVNDLPILRAWNAYRADRLSRKFKRARRHRAQIVAAEMDLAQGITD